MPQTSPTCGPPVRCGGWALACASCSRRSRSGSIGWWTGTTKPPSASRRTRAAAMVCGFPSRRAGGQYGNWAAPQAREVTQGGRCGGNPPAQERPLAAERPEMQCSVDHGQLGAGIPQRKPVNSGPGRRPLPRGWGCRGGRPFLCSRARQPLRRSRAVPATPCPERGRPRTRRGRHRRRRWYPPP